MSSKKRAASKPRKYNPSRFEIERTAVLHEGEPPNRAARRAKRVRPRGLPRPLARLGKDGSEIGYYADPVRWDDCLRAAIATATQIPIGQVPDPRLHERLDAGDDPDTISDESWLTIGGWAEDRGLQLMLHDEVPADRERWIGVCVYTPTGDEPELNPFPDHCLVMSYGSVIFDPAASVIAPRGMRLRTWDASDVTYGLSFDPQDKED